MRIGIDLCELDPKYGGGVNSFAFGLIAGLLAAKARDDTLVMMATPGNEAFLRQAYKDRSDVSVLLLPLGARAHRTDNVLVLSSWLLHDFRLRYWFDKFVRRDIMRMVEQSADAVIAPLTVMRLFGARVPTMVSIHDIQQEYHPEFFTWRQRIARWAPYRLSAWRATRIQSSSIYIRECLVEKFGVDAGKIVVIPEGVDRDRFSPQAPIEHPPAIAPGTPFIFYPAQIWPHKNHLMLMDALALHRDRTGLELVCVLTGKDYGHWPAVAAKIAALGLKQVHYLGLVSLPQLIWLYGNCQAVLALGMHESSSLPLREGASFGKFLVAMDIPPNRETARDLKVQIVVTASDLAEVLDDLARDMAPILAQGAENATLAIRFDWTAIAGKYLRVLHSLVSERDSS